jgi:peptide/nickel transport system substrate-binding protein/oligopeptide transport system substrate-binding protein
LTFPPFLPIYIREFRNSGSDSNLRKSLRSYILIYLLILGSFFFFQKNLSAETRGEREVPSQGGVYRRPLEFNPKTLDPALAIDIYSVTVIQQIFDGLVQFDKDLNVIPAIAKSWKISPDGLTYTFYLREGVKFHNGREVTADDIIYSMTRIIDPKTKSPGIGFLERVLGFKEFQEGNANHVKGFYSKGKYIFEMKLSEPYAPFISVLGMNKFKVLPKEEVEKSGIDFGKFPVGTGPFKFVSMKEGEEIVLEANPDYFEGRPYLDKIFFKIFHGAPREKIFKEFKERNLGESFISPEELEDVVKEKQFLFLKKPILSLRFYGLNISSKPLDNKNLRKAINFAIDKKSIISEIHKNQFNLTKSILPPGMPGYDPMKNPYPFNETQATKLLSEGGFPKGKGIPPLEIWSASNSEAAQGELNEIKLQLNNIGIKSNIHFETNWPNFESMLTANKAPVFIYAWYADFPDPDNFLGVLFHSKSKYNYMAYHNPKVDHLLEKAKTERDYLKRMEMYRKAEEIILDDAPIIPMVNHLFQMAYQPYVRGVEVTALGGPYIPMKKIWLKK